ncbi:uncharacterized protein RHOBADRAFT_51317 [Rhodotorula graminis WP1]|uniref:Fe2OG dioxygenase domain-containing protein n=1 Tax=Rhodotorula graminis (strain WP1) TaxID=578459 RepID=A0A194S9R3_RHOGW|nr:uncharacterized protein RHOBADRAFT_51317 [Rhodotorula graminis WP1]KPV77468.1 hypothetical protein RHOBADRAFT_51317 [Rhodotorula graminis WP1]
MSTSTLTTGLGQRLVSASTDAAAFTALPIISLARLNGSLDDRKALAAEIQDAAVNTGFMYIADHGVAQEVIDAAFDQAKQFFAQPTDKKMLVRDAESFRGFAPLKGENVDPAARGDIHEAWDMGDDAQVMKEGSNHGNVWPPADDLPDFKPTLQKTWDEIMALGKRLFPLFALALGLDEHYFDDKLRRPGHTMRVLYYPPQFGEIDARELGIGAHTDYECFTLLLQHGDTQALQVLNSAGEWVIAPPVPGTFVLNIADMLQRMSNGLFRSTVHRAINRSGVSRYSLPFFFGLDYDAEVAVIPSCVTPDRPALYEPVKAGDYVEQRLAETYIKSDPAQEVEAAA